MSLRFYYILSYSWPGLEYEKYTIEEAEDGEAGLEALKKKDFDVVLCDMKMPKMDGLQLLEQFGQIGKDTPFIMISAHEALTTPFSPTSRPSTELYNLSINILGRFVMFSYT